MKTFRVAVLLFVSALAASFAGETNTLPTVIIVDGITYSNVTWRTVTPATASITHRTGAASIPLWKLPPELQTRFGYDPQKAREYLVAQRNAEIARQAALQNIRAQADLGGLGETVEQCKARFGKPKSETQDQLLLRNLALLSTL